MKVKNIDSIKRSNYLKISDLDNYFNIYEDRKNNYVFNLNNSIYIDADESALKTYECKHDMHWTLISYLIYGTTRLAWLLYKVNNVLTKDIFKIKYAGEKVKYIAVENLENLISTISD